MSFDAIHAAILDGIHAAQKQYPLAVGLIGILGREWDMPTASRVTDFFIANRDTILAMDLANDEANFPSGPFAGVFRRAREAGLRLTVHAGESLIPTSSQSIRSALDELGAERIGHGVQIYRDPALMAEVAERGVLLELCPSSNVRTRCIESLAKYPINAIRAAGIRVSINADDGVFDYDLNHEYRAIADLHGLTMRTFPKSIATPAPRVLFPRRRRKNTFPRMEHPGAARYRGRRKNGNFIAG